MLLKNCRLERKQQLLSRYVMPGVSFIDYTGTFVKHNAPNSGKILEVYGGQGMGRLGPPGQGSLHAGLHI